MEQPRRTMPSSRGVYRPRVIPEGEFHGPRVIADEVHAGYEEPSTSQRVPLTNGTSVGQVDSSSSSSAYPCRRKGCVGNKAHSRVI